jgi:hypothetical protein
MKTRTAQIPSRWGISKVWLVVGFCVLGLILFVALNRRNISAGLNTPIRLDDFVFTIVSAKKVPDARGSSGRVRYVVTMRIANQAKRVDWRFQSIDPVLIDSTGRAYSISPEAQRAHEAETGQPDPTAQPIPAGKVVLKDLVYEVPADLEEPSMKLLGGAGDVLETVFFGRKRFILP